MKARITIRLIVVAVLTAAIAYSAFWGSAFLAWKLYPYPSTADYTQHLGVLINHSFGERFGAMVIISLLGFMAAKLNRPSWKIGLATGALATVFFHLIAIGAFISLHGMESYCTHHKFWRPLLDNLCFGVLFALLAVRKQYATEKRHPTRWRRRVEMNKIMSIAAIVITLAALVFAIQTYLIADHMTTQALHRREPITLLDSARAEVAANATNFIARERTDALFAKLAILESQTDGVKALDRARAIREPFYSSLALGGIAAVELRSSSAASTNHFCEALISARGINHWTGSHAGSLGFLFGLIPTYPTKEATVLLAKSKEAFDAWQASDCQKGESLLAFAKAASSVSPTNAEPLLLNVALKSNHYWDSIEYLAGFLAKQSPDGALRLAESHYQSGRDWPNDQYFLRAVLIEMARTDFDGAFQGIKKMRGLDREIAAVELAKAMLAAKRRHEAEEVTTYIGGLTTDFGGTKESLDKLRRQLAEEGQSPAAPASAGPEMIDRFLKGPTPAQLQSLAEKARVTFRDKQQTLAFVAAALPLVETIRDKGYPYHGSPRSIALGILVLCSAIAGETDAAIETARRIDIPEIRISYLLDAYDLIRPMPSAVEDWPIHFWQRTSVTIQKNNGPNQVQEDTARKLADPQH